MKSYAAWIVAAALCTGAAAQLQAQDAAPAPSDQPKKHTPPSAEEMFKKMDTNGDGQISLDEFKAAMAERAKNRPDGKAMPAEMIEKRFKAMDTDGNGTVSLEEFKKAREERPRGPHGDDASKTSTKPPAAAPATPPPAAAPAASPAAPAPAAP